MDTLWPNVLPVYRLGICLIPCPLGTQRLPQDFPGGQPASGHALSLSFLPFLGLGLPLLFSVTKVLGAVWTISLKRQQGPVAVAVVTLP